MSGFPFFDPSRPPPSLWNVDSSTDQRYIQNFLNGRYLLTKEAFLESKTSSIISIGCLKTRLTDLVREIEELKTKKETLEKEIELQPASEWKLNVERLKQFQTSIDNKLLELNNPETNIQLKRKLHARRKKRAWEKRRNFRLKVEREHKVRYREQLHTQIDQWQQEQRKLVEAEKQIQQQLDFASHFLADVHRRKAACKRYLAKFEKMKEMKSQRQTNALHDTDDKRIDEEISQLTKTWASKLSECIKEEKRLKDVLARRSTANFQRRVENQWNRLLFGDTIPKKFEHPLLVADRDRDALIETRWAWDACLVDEGVDQDGASVMPMGWVLPPKHPLPEWAKYNVKDL